MKQSDINKLREHAKLWKKNSHDVSHDGVEILCDIVIELANALEQSQASCADHRADVRNMVSSVYGVAYSNERRAGTI
jgi:hypothetical protein